MKKSHEDKTRQNRVFSSKYLLQTIRGAVQIPSARGSKKEVDKHILFNYYIAHFILNLLCDRHCLKQMCRNSLWRRNPVLGLIIAKAHHGEETLYLEF